MINFSIYLNRYVFVMHNATYRTANRGFWFNDYKGLESINYTTVKYVETLYRRSEYGRHTALKGIVLMIKKKKALKVMTFVKNE